MLVWKHLSGATFNVTRAIYRILDCWYKTSNKTHGQRFCYLHKPRKLAIKLYTASSTVDQLCVKRST